MKIDQSTIQFDKLSTTPGTPPAGESRVYASSSGSVIVQDTSGTELTASNSISGIGDYDSVVINAPQDGEVFRFINGNWVNDTAINAPTTFDDLTDVNETSPAFHHDILIYDRVNALYLSIGRRAALLYTSSVDQTFDDRDNLVSDLDLMLDFRNNVTVTGDTAERPASALSRDFLNGFSRNASIRNENYVLSGQITLENTTNTGFVYITPAETAFSGTQLRLNSAATHLSSLSTGSNFPTSVSVPSDKVFTAYFSDQNKSVTINIWYLFNASTNYDPDIESDQFGLTIFNSTGGNITASYNLALRHATYGWLGASKYNTAGG